MTSRRLMRYQSTQGLAEGVAHRLVQTIVRIQAAQERIDLCLTGGRIANIVYAAMEAFPNAPTFVQTSYTSGGVTTDSSLPAIRTAIPCKPYPYCRQPSA